MIITGVTGFVGVNLLPYLEKNDCIVFSSSRSERSNAKVRFLTYSELTANQMNELAIDGLIHLAGKAHDLKNITNDEEYINANTKLTSRLFDEFLRSSCKVFIYLSSVKAVVDKTEHPLVENVKPEPVTAYGKSKLMAENYLLSKSLPEGKRLYILRPCMIHGRGNKGNLSLLYRFVTKGIPYPLSKFDNLRSFLSIDNLCFVINELIKQNNIPSGIYNIADNDPISTRSLVKLMGEVLDKKIFFLNIPVWLIRCIARLGDFFHLPFTSERLSKLTSNYVVNNQKILSVLKKSLPLDTKEGLKRTLISLKNVE